MVKKAFHNLLKILWTATWSAIRICNDSLVRPCESKKTTYLTFSQTHTARLTKQNKTILVLTTYITISLFGSESRTSLDNYVQTLILKLQIFCSVHFFYYCFDADASEGINVLNPSESMKQKKWHKNILKNLVKRILCNESKFLFLMDLSSQQ